MFSQQLINYCVCCAGHRTIKKRPADVGEKVVVAERQGCVRPSLLIQMVLALPFDQRGQERGIPLHRVIYWWQPPPPPPTRYLSPLLWWRHCARALSLSLWSPSLCVAGLCPSIVVDCRSDLSQHFTVRNEWLNEMSLKFSFLSLNVIIFVVTSIFKAVLCLVFLLLFKFKVKLRWHYCAYNLFSILHQ